MTEEAALRGPRLPAMEQPRRVSNRRGQQSREEILEAASRVMAERGYAGTSISTLISATGLPKSAIYHHFHSKGGLLSAVMERGAYAFFAALQKAHADPPEGGTHLERLRWFLVRTAEVFAGQPDFLRLHMLLLMSKEAADVDVEIAPVIAQVRRDGRAYMEEQIAAAYADLGPERARAVAAELAYFAIAGFDGAFVAWQSEPERRMVDQMDQLAVALDALAGPVVAAR
jgi:AcrR family transcriptional regulator